MLFIIFLRYECHLCHRTSLTVSQHCGLMISDCIKWTFHLHKYRIEQVQSCSELKQAGVEIENQQW